MKRQNKIHNLYLKLYKKHGDPEKFWPQWCAKKKTSELRELVAIGAILTQRTSWHNADLALRNLKKEKLLSLKSIASLKGLDKLTELIKPAGFYQTKPKRLFGLASFIIDNYENLGNFSKENLIVARGKLLNLYGIGPETADTILLYAVDRPTFVIDEYTKRLVSGERLSNKLAYDHLKELFEISLPKKVEIYQNFHALIIVEQKGKRGSIMRVV